MSSCAACSRYFLKMDVRLYFPSIDHEILLAPLEKRVKDPRVLALARCIVESSNPQDPAAFYFPGDDLFTPAEPRRGLWLQYLHDSSRCGKALDSP